MKEMSITAFLTGSEKGSLGSAHNVPCGTVVQSLGSKRDTIGFTSSQ